MERAAVKSVLRPASGAIGWCALLALALPLCTALFLHLSLPAAGALVASAFVIEYGSIPIGIGLGLPVPYVVGAATSIEAGIFLGLFGMLDTIGTASGRVARFLAWVHSLVIRSRMFDRYGTFGLFPAEIIIGVYLCAPAAWLFGWHRWRSFAITMAGYLVAAAVTTLATLGVIQYFFH